MKITTKLAGISSLILLFFFLLSDPRELPSFFLVVPFLLLFLSLFLVGLQVLGRYGVARPKRMRMGLTIAAIPVTLLVFQSLGQLTGRDILAVCALAIIAHFYLSRFGMRTAR